MTPKIDTNRRDFDREVAQIRGYADLTEEAKRRMMAEAYGEASGRHRELVAEQERKAAERLECLEQGVMGIRYPMHASDGDKGLVRMGYRDAYDRAERTAGEASEKLTALQERAERSGDPHLADAVYHVSTERGPARRGRLLLPREPARGAQAVGGVRGGEKGGGGEPR